MKMYTNKKTGEKITEQEMMKRRQERLKRQKRAKLFAIGCFISVLVMGAHFLASVKVSALEAQFKNMYTVEIRMQPNQTVWSIIEELTPEQDTREVLYAMKSMNDGKNLSETKAYSDVITFYVDDAIDLSTLNHLNIESCTK